MIFRHRERDTALHQQLLNNGVIKGREWQEFAKPEDEGDLLAILLDNADKVDGQRWVYWLVKHHGMTRINHPKLDREWAKTLSITPPDALTFVEAGVYPLGLSGRSLLIGAVRPDRRDAVELAHKRCGGANYFIMALTPADARALDTFYRERVDKGNGRS